MVRELFPNIDPIWRIRVNGKWEHPTSVIGQTYRLDPDTSLVEEFANSLTQVECQWVEVFTEFDTTQHALLHSNTIITTARTTLRGTITRRQLQDTIDTMRSRFIETEDGYATEDTSPPAKCILCHTTDPDVHCTALLDAPTTPTAFVLNHLTQHHGFALTT